MGKLRLQEIQPAHIKQLFARKKDEDRVPRTLQYIHSALHCALQAAVHEGILGRNPVDAVERPNVELSEFRILTEKQCRQFLIAAAESPNEVLYWMALTTDMRQGELLGLKWAGMDWDKGTLLIQCQLLRLEHRGLALTPPKTSAGRRMNKLGPGMREKLSSHSKISDCA
jgi:integrase